uniref:HMG box domain-containing protein n=1 Tax=Anopheles epiroticus TaxID=199890 RepID=A0A182PB47_9DIPT
MSSKTVQPKQEPGEPEQSGGQSSAQRSGAVCKPGKQTRNPYLNFLRDFRRKNCHLSVVEIVRQGAEQWRRLTDEQKLPYVRIAFYTPLKRKRCPVCPSMPGRRMRQAMKQRKAAKNRRSGSNNRVKKENSSNK